MSFTSTQGDYTVMFPGTPQTQTQNAPLSNGATLLLEIVGAEEGQQFFATARGEYPAGSITDVAQSLQGAEDQAIANVNGTLIDSQDITLQGRPGRQFSASVTQGGTAGTVIQRVFLDGDIIYENIIVGPGTISVGDEDVAAFLGSFAFTSSSRGGDGDHVVELGEGDRRARAPGRRRHAPAPAAPSAATWATTSSIVPVPDSSVHHSSGMLDDTVLAVLGDRARPVRRRTERGGGPWTGWRPSRR